MTDSQQLAWAILTLDEQTALGLHLGMNKSSWEVGEIMDKSHYKYLEIKYRAQHFLKLFSDHIDLFDSIIPRYLKGDKVVLMYFKLCIERRQKPLYAITEIAKEHGKIHKANLNLRIIKQLRDWQKEDDQFAGAFFELVKEFDRWNNFRILPKEIQEPSAFKRRIKNFYKKQIKTLKILHPLAITKLKKLYETKNSPSTHLALLTPLPEAIKVKQNKGSMEIINNLGLYTFKSKPLATEYITLIYHYLNKDKKGCNDGLDFWPKYRELIKKADNYEVVLKISPVRKHLIMAMQKLEYL